MKTLNEKQFRAAVREFAADTSSANQYRPLLESEHNRRVSQQFEDYQYTPEFMFLSEIFSPVPDLVLRARYRKTVLETRA